MSRELRSCFPDINAHSLILIAWVLHTANVAAAAGNLLPTTSFAEGLGGWDGAGEATTVQVDGSRAYRDGAALRIEDRGNQLGQANSGMISVDAEQRYFASLRLRIDPDMPGRVVVDLQSFTVDRAVRGGATRRKKVESVAGPGFDGNRQQLEYFGQCIQSGKPDLSNLHLNLTASRMALEVNVKPTDD